MRAGDLGVVATDAARGGVGAAWLRLAEESAEPTQFDVVTVHETEQGSSSTHALGYHFRSDAGEGALDITGSGRAWVPKDLGEEPLLNLVCGYAGLVLYRPTEG